MAVIYNEIGNAGNIAFMLGDFEAIPAQQAKGTAEVSNSSFAPQKLPRKGMIYWGQ